MKKTITLLLTSIFILSIFSGCGMTVNMVNDALEEEAGQVTTETNILLEIPDDGTIDYGDGTYTEVLLPSSYMGTTTFDEMQEEIATRGGKDLSILEDGTISYFLPTPEYEKTLAQLKYSVLSSASALIGEACPSFSSVVYADDLLSAEIHANKTEYETSMDGLVVYKMYFNVSMYHVFTGVNEDEVPFTIYLIDEDTDEIFDTIVFPETK